MRRLGITPLTGAEKQKRHREKIKARLAEAELLKRRLADPGASAQACLIEWCGSVLKELGAEADERAALAGEIEDLQEEVGFLIRERASRALKDLRSKARRTRPSLLARLSSDKPRGVG